ncbi:hypothetical protein HOLleu_05882 [Holothuria leucospilota]|uniref:SCAN box domain-containing protein n=1 Tax=Holothuria leucospilota TaxID=206669 RepID=A0A9Q1CK59_HOLLE|nr:hypothetical protein HOLleu_05882 [Holothuria leucospilota]
MLLKSSLKLYFQSDVEKLKIFFVLLLSLEIALLVSSTCTLVGRKMDFEKYITLGKESGLKGDALIEFAREREKIARDERQKEREHQKEMKEYDLKIASTGSNLADSKGGLGNTAPTKLPKLPLFKEGTDDMDAFILRFERFATAANWPRTIWATSMGALLTGRALEVYSRMSDSQSKDYAKLKSALLFKFQLTADGFRGKFRNSRCESRETYSQYLERIKSYLIRWIEMSKKQKTYDDLLDLLLQEQMINSSSKELAVFLKERTPDKASDMALLADKYREAYGNYDKGIRVLRIGLETKMKMIKMELLKAQAKIVLVTKR